MGIHNVINITGQAQREFGKGNHLRVPAACSASLDVHGGSTRWLTNGASCMFSPLAQPFNQTYSGSCFAFTQRGWRDRGNLYIFSVWFLFESFHDLRKSDAPNFAMRNNLIIFKTQFISELPDRFHVLFCSLGNFPVSHSRRVVGHSILRVLWFEVFYVNYFIYFSKGAFTPLRFSSAFQYSIRSLIKVSQLSTSEPLKPFDIISFL